MSKSILFIAVQCHQCSTMQVKQQKKSSNKWNCAVCNEKQSVRKVYAQGFQAKDIRHVVRSFNMSRKFADDRKCEEPSLGHFVEHLEGDNVMADKEEAVRRRSDWSEYVEDFDDQSIEPAYLKSKFQGDQKFNQKVVTELPEELMFKKPKLKGNFGTSSLKAGESRTYKPQYSKRSATTKDLSATPPVSSSIPTEWNEFKSNVDADHSPVICRQFQQRLQKSKDAGAMKTGSSRWAEYLMEDDECHYEGKKTAFADDSRVAVQTNDADLLVEEDIHPDFR